MAENKEKQKRTSGDSTRSSQHSNSNGRSSQHGNNSGSARVSRQSYSSDSARVSRQSYNSGSNRGSRYSNDGSNHSRVRTDKNIGMRELRSDPDRPGGQDEAALARERARRRRRRREIELKRRKRRRIIALVKVFLCLIVAVLALAGVLAVVRKYQGDRKAAADEAAAAAEAAQTTDIYQASDVLQLSFPVLTLDEASSSSQTGNSSTLVGDGISDGDDTSDSDGTMNSDGTTNSYGTANSGTAVSGEDTADADDASEDGTASDTDETAGTAADSGSDTGSGTLTVSEFQNILQDLYDQNYVLVDVYSLAQSTSTGFEGSNVSVPKGKKPLVISETGLGYKSGYDGHADQMVEDGNGGITNTYTDADGKLQSGDVDVAACVDAFVEAHPDFSYKDARGVLGITGNEGMLGYALKESGKQVGQLSADAVREASGESVSSSSATDDGSAGESLVSSDSTENAGTAGNTGSSGDTAASGSTSAEGSEITSEQVDQNKETLTTLISTLRSEGWHLASGTYADISYASDAQLVQTDADSWSDEIGSLVGDTDILVLPHGGDIGSWSGYSESDERYSYLEKLGFRYYLTENDQEFSWVQIGTDYVRFGTHTVYSKADYDQVMQMK